MTGVQTCALPISPIDAEFDTEKGASRLLKRVMNLLTPKEQPKEESIPVTESMLAAFVTPPDDALMSRGLTKEAVANYNILWNRLDDNWIIPIRSTSGALMGWQEKGYSTRYFNNYPKGIKKGKALFGFDQYAGNEMVVLESPLDVARLASVTGYTGVATFGCTITKEQFNVIRGADKVIFALDNDDAGRAASKEMLERCKESGTEAWFFDYSHTDMKDIGGMSKSEIEWGLENARHIVRGEIGRAHV